MAQVWRCADFNCVATGGNLSHRLLCENSQIAFVEARAIASLQDAMVSETFCSEQ